MNATDRTESERILLEIDHLLTEDERRADAGPAQFRSEREVERLMAILDDIERKECAS